MFDHDPKDPGYLRRISMSMHLAHPAAWGRRLVSAAVGLSCLAVLSFSSALAADSLPEVRGIDAQPLKAQAKRVAEALGYLGEPLSADEQAALDKALAATDEAEAVAAIQKVFDPRCLAGVNINPESRV
jgi:hypothetical protein